MTTVELIAELRIKFADTVGTEYLVSDDDILVALSRAQNIFAVETLCIFDLTTADAIATNPLITLPTRTVNLKSALFNTTLLTLVTQHELDYGYFSLNNREASNRFSDWRNATGTPKFLVTDLGPLTARLVPYPSVNGTINLERYKLPLELTLLIDPEIPEQFHRDLITGALTYLYTIVDADVYAPEEGIILSAKWERVLIEARIQLQTDLRRQERRLSLPPEVEFMQGKGNTNGLNQNTNT